MSPENKCIATQSNVLAYSNFLTVSFNTLAPFFTAALVSEVAQLAGSMVPSPGLWRVPYKSSTFSSG